MWVTKSIIGRLPLPSLPRWLRKLKLAGSSASNLLPTTFANNCAAADSTSTSVSEIQLGDSASFPPPSSLSSESSSPSRDTATRTAETAASDANGSEEPVRTSGGSDSPPEPSSATTADHEDALKVFIMNVAANITLVVNIDDISSSWKTEWKVVYGICVLLSFLSTVTSICAAWPRASSWAGTFSSFCARFGLLVATAVFVVNTTCQLGPFGCVAGVPVAALFVLFLAVVWWKC